MDINFIETTKKFTPTNDQDSMLLKPLKKTKTHACDILTNLHHEKTVKSFICSFTKFSWNNKLLHTECVKELALPLFYICNGGKFRLRTLYMHSNHSGLKYLHKFRQLPHLSMNFFIHEHEVLRYSLYFQNMVWHWQGSLKWMFSLFYLPDYLIILNFKKNRINNCYFKNK